LGPACGIADAPQREPTNAMSQGQRSSKTPEITLGFWIIKIIATTLGETGGDTLSMSLNLGYLASTAIFTALFVVAVTAQLRASRYHAPLYWLVIVATTLVGTTLADFADRSLGIGYPGGSTLLFGLLMLSLATWYFTKGSVSVARITSPRVETFYWVTILFSNTLGTALGDFLSDQVGFDGGAVVFGAALAVLAILYFFTSLSRAALFWAAFILTRPLGATLGDMLTKPTANGGLDLSRLNSSLVLAAFMIAGIFFLSRRPGEHPGRA
jgi:uncharacterized membrane-anchored protein